MCTIQESSTAVGLGNILCCSPPIHLFFQNTVLKMRRGKLAQNVSLTSAFLKRNHLTQRCQQTSCWESAMHNLLMTFSFLRSVSCVVSACLHRNRTIENVALHFCQSKEELWVYTSKVGLLFISFFPFKSVLRELFKVVPKLG